MLETDEQSKEPAFQAEDFDAYLPTKWSSNMYTLERRRVKNKLENIGNILEEEIKNAGLTLIQHLSDEFPSLWNKKQVERQWLFFSRDEAARKELTNIIDREKTLADTLADPTPLYRHVFVGVSVSETHLEIGIRLHFDAWVDRKNLLNLMADTERKARFENELKNLPEHFEIGLDGEPLTTIGIIDSDGLDSLLSRFESEHGWIFIGARLPKDQVLIIGADIVESAGAVFRALLPVYKYVTWSPSNDLISIDEVVAAHNEAIKQSREELDRERRERENRLREREVIGLAMREQIAERIEATQAWRSREIAAKRAAFLKAQSESKESDARAKAEAMAASWGLGAKGKDGNTSDAPAPPKSATAGPPKPRRQERFNKTTTKSDRSHREKKPITPATYQPHHGSSETTGSSEIAIGHFVEVTKGFLKGRRGTVHEIDEKGGLKIAFGALTSRLEKNEVRFLSTSAPTESYRPKDGKHRPRSAKH